jgi:hypothetical protein
MTSANETEPLLMYQTVTLGQKSLQEKLTLETVIAVSYLETKMKIHHSIM